MSNEKLNKRKQPLKNCCNSAKDVELLRNLGRVKDLPNGGSVILSSPNLTSFHIPRRLKMKNVLLWENSDHIWLNM